MSQLLSINLTLDVNAPILEEHCKKEYEPHVKEIIDSTPYIDRKEIFNIIMNQ